MLDINVQPDVCNKFNYSVYLNEADIGDFFQQSLKIEHTVEAHLFKKSSGEKKLAPSSL